VAQVTLQSRPAGADCGAEISCHAGDLSPVRAWNGAPGTRIEVRHLFFNTPVRRKFLRTIATEMGHINEMFTRLALSHSEPHWTLRHNGKALYDIPPSAGLSDRIRLFFGKEVSERLYEVHAPQGSTTLRGWIADPACERGNAKMQYLFVNGRWIRDRSLGHALQEAYRGLLMTGRYAVAFLFLDLPPDQVDVNVHPTKVEVRFRDSNALHHLVFTAVRERLRRANLTARLQVPSTLAAPKPTGGPTAGEEDLWPEMPVFPPLRPLARPEPAFPGPPPATMAVPDSPPVLPQANGQEHAPVTPPPSVPPPSFASPASFKAIQLYDTYLVLETAEGMLVIDQHALHERVLFEELKQRLRTGPLEMQRLLIPEPVDLTPEAAARTLECREALADLGLEVSDFGGGTLLLSGYPAILSRQSPRAILQKVVDHLVAKDRLPSREVLLNDLLSLMACHAAVKAGDRLTPEEIAALVARRSLADDTHHCPHGRPTALLFSRHELERQFRRV
jgi:DNA mismatch repair protein MutL